MFHTNAIQLPSCCMDRTSKSGRRIPPGGPRAQIVDALRLRVELEVMNFDRWAEVVGFPAHA